MSSNEEILKSPYDKRLYKNIWLSNEMQCLLISDSGFSNLIVLFLILKNL